MTASHHIFFVCYLPPRVLAQGACVEGTLHYKISVEIGEHPYRIKELFNFFLLLCNCRGLAVLPLVDIITKVPGT